MNYYTTDNKNKIIETSIFGCEPHWLNCNQTEEEIVRFEGQLMLNSEFEALSQTPEYIAEEQRKEQERKAQRKITKRQMLFWLYLNKQKTESDILNAINTIPDETQKYLAGVSYNGTNDFYYGNEFVPIIGLALGLAVQDLDKMFDEAVEL